MIKSSKKNAALLLALSLGAAAAVRADSSDLQSSLDVQYASKYIFRGVELTSEAIQPDFELTSGTPAGAQEYGGIWGNYPLITKDKNEFDFYAGYRAPIQAGSDWKFDVGATLYDFPQGFYIPKQSDSSAEIYLGLTGGKATLADGRLVLMPSLYVYHDFTREDYTVVGAVDFSFPVERIGSSLDVTLRVGGVTAQRTPDYTYGGADVTMPFAIGPKATFTIGGHYNTSDLDNTAHNICSFTAGVTYRF